jgi:hypothetical protein
VKASIPLWALLLLALLVAGGYTLWRQQMQINGLRSAVHYGDPIDVLQIGDVQVITRAKAPTK